MFDFISRSENSSKDKIKKMFFSSMAEEVVEQLHKKQKLFDGLALLAKGLQDNVYNSEEESVDAQALKELKTVLKQFKDEKRYLPIGSGVLQERLGFSELIMERFYEVAKGLYIRHDFEDAVLSFYVLATLNPFKSHYWVGLGAANQQLELYGRAVAAYAQAREVDALNPFSYLYAIQCHLKLKEEVAAQKLFIMVSSLSLDEQLREQLEKLKRKLF